MASKATAKTDNHTLVRDILGDQSAMMLPHLKRGEVRQSRLDHNVTELLRRLGEKPDGGPYWVL